MIYPAHIRVTMVARARTENRGREAQSEIGANEHGIPGKGQEGKERVAMRGIFEGGPSGFMNGVDGGGLWG
jgi:hypothetical protein